MIKPVDVQTIYPRSMDVQKVQEVDLNRPGLDQHTFAREMTQQSQQRQIQVPTNNASDAGNTIHQDLSEKEKRRRNSKARSGDKKKTTEPELPDTGRGHHIDFKV